MGHPNRLSTQAQKRTLSSPRKDFDELCRKYVPWPDRVTETVPRKYARTVSVWTFDVKRRKTTQSDVTFLKQFLSIKPAFPSQLNIATQTDVNWRKMTDSKLKQFLRLCAKPRNCLDSPQIVYHLLRELFDIKWNTHYIFFTHEPNLKGIQSLEALIGNIRLCIIIPIQAIFLNFPKMKPPNT